MRLFEFSKPFKQGVSARRTGNPVRRHWRNAREVDTAGFFAFARSHAENAIETGLENAIFRPFFS